VAPTHATSRASPRARLLTDKPLALRELAVFVAGGLFFRHLKRGFADVL